MVIRIPETDPIDLSRYTGKIIRRVWFDVHSMDLAIYLAEATPNELAALRHSIGHEHFSEMIAERDRMIEHEIVTPDNLKKARFEVSISLSCHLRPWHKRIVFQRFCMAKNAKRAECMPATPFHCISLGVIEDPFLYARTSSLEALTFPALRNKLRLIEEMCWLRPEFAKKLCDEERNPVIRAGIRCILEQSGVEIETVIAAEARSYLAGQRIKLNLCRLMLWPAVREISLPREKRDLGRTKMDKALRESGLDELKRLPDSGLAAGDVRKRFIEDYTLEELYQHLKNLELCICFDDLSHRQDESCHELDALIRMALYDLEGDAMFISYCSLVQREYLFRISTKLRMIRTAFAAYKYHFTGSATEVYLLGSDDYRQERLK